MVYWIGGNAGLVDGFKRFCKKRFDTEFEVG